MFRIIASSWRFAGEASRLKVPAIWMQEGIIHDKATAKARKAGIFVVMDHCMLKKRRRRFS